MPAPPPLRVQLGSGAWGVWGGGGVWANGREQPCSIKACNGAVEGQGLETETQIQGERFTKC